MLIVLILPLMVLTSTKSCNRIPPSSSYVYRSLRAINVSIVSPEHVLSCILTAFERSVPYFAVTRCRAQLLVVLSMTALLSACFNHVRPAFSAKQKALAGVRPQP